MVMAQHFTRENATAEFRGSEVLNESFRKDTLMKKDDKNGGSRDQEGKAELGNTAAQLRLDRVGRR